MAGAGTEDLPPNNVAIEGTFDDCQDLVKAMFADEVFRNELQLGAMNSINWGRVVAQIPYYVTAQLAVGHPCTFAVPTGNFGNVLAGWYARRMGAAIERFIIGSNSNDILARWVEGGALVAGEVVPTWSPSMDIQVSSNLERLLFELLDRDGARTADLMVRFREIGSVEVERCIRSNTVFIPFKKKSRACVEPPWRADVATNSSSFGVANLRPSSGKTDDSGFLSQT